MFFKCILTSLLIGTYKGQPAEKPTEECCRTKEVGGVGYVLVSEGKVPKPCLSGCIYQQHGMPGSKYCFARGSLPITCGDDTINEDALAAYRLGLSSGDSEIIIRLAVDSFNFTWVPESMVMNRDEYAQFLGKFKEEAEKDGRPKFSMRFNNLIQRKVGNTIFEAGDWIVDNFDSGVYMHAAQAGRIILDMATNSYDADAFNEDTLAAYRLGLTTGDSETIIRMAADSFNFTWVPESMVMNRDEYVQFLGKFKEEAEKEGRPKFSMRFDKLIQRKVGDTIIEAGDWIVDGYDRGVYMHAAQGGNITWDMATNY